MAILILVYSFLCGCASFTMTQTEDGTNRVTTLKITTFMDSHNNVSKLKTTFTDKSQGISLGSLSENSSSTNIVEALRIIGGLLTKLP